MESTKIHPISAEMEDSAVTFRIRHLDAIPRVLFSKIFALAQSHSGQPATGESSTSQDSAELECSRYTTSIRHLERARVVADIQTSTYEEQSQNLKHEIEEETRILEQEKILMLEQEKITETFEMTKVKAKELSSRPKQRADLDRLIADISAEIAVQKEKTADYLLEATTRRITYQSISSTLQSIIDLAHVDPERDPSELARKDKDTIIKTSTGSSRDSPAGKMESSGSAGDDIKASLDPKAAIFTPTPKPVPSLHRSTSSLRPIPGLPSRPIGNYKDLVIPKGSVLPIAIGSTTAPTTRSNTPHSGQGREKEATTSSLVSRLGMGARKRSPSPAPVSATPSKSAKRSRSKSRTRSNDPKSSRANLASDGRKVEPKTGPHEIITIDEEPEDELNANLKRTRHSQDEESGKRRRVEEIID